VPIRQPNGSAHVRVLSEHPRFGAGSNYTKSNQLRPVPVPNMYLFGTVSTKTPPVIVAATAGGVLARESRSRPPQPGKTQPKCPPRISSPRNPPVLAAVAKDGEGGYLAPTSAT